MSFPSKIIDLIVKTVSMGDAFHFSASAIMAAVAKLLCLSVGLPYLMSAGIALFVVFVIWALKELADDKFDFRYLLSDFIGCAVGVI